MARRRRLRRRALQSLVPLVVVLVPILWAFDCTGPEEIVKAEVIRTQRWRHITRQTGPHTHIRATLLIEGRSKTTIDQGDAYQRGQWVPVWIRRGRLSGWPYFEDLARPGDMAAQPAPSPTDQGPAPSNAGAAPRGPGAMPADTGKPAGATP